jgi:hypothetical protein
MADIRKDSPVLIEMEWNGSIKIAGAMYNLETGHRRAGGLSARCAHKCQSHKAGSGPRALSLRGRARKATRLERHGPAEASARSGRGGCMVGGGRCCCMQIWAPVR